MNCTTPGCELGAGTTGLCPRHYADRLRSDIDAKYTSGSLNRGIQYVDPQTGRLRCIEAGCNNIAKAKKRCSRHYEELRTRNKAPQSQ